MKTFRMIVLAVIAAITIGGLSVDACGVLDEYVQLAESQPYSGSSKFIIKYVQQLKTMGPETKEFKDAKDRLDREKDLLNKQIAYYADAPLRDGSAGVAVSQGCDTDADSRSSLDGSGNVVAGLGIEFAGLGIDVASSGIAGADALSVDADPRSALDGSRNDVAGLGIEVPYHVSQDGEADDLASMAADALSPSTDHVADSEVAGSGGRSQMAAADVAASRGAIVTASPRADAGDVSLRPDTDADSRSAGSGIDVAGSRIPGAGSRIAGYDARYYDARYYDTDYDSLSADDVTGSADLGVIVYPAVSTVGSSQMAAAASRSSDFVSRNGDDDDVSRSVYTDADSRRADAGLWSAAGSGDCTVSGSADLGLVGYPAVVGSGGSLMAAGGHGSRSPGGVDGVEDGGKS
eukprot:GHVS01002410.1.p1 GENE.GHVS01002410.1~~GHVS01002410.1.p1  ORF type:complete len:406 (-),score=54.50 GHVS01002410.1:743-1960(-)